MAIEDYTIRLDPVTNQLDNIVIGIFADEISLIKPINFSYIA